MELTLNSLRFWRETIKRLVLRTGDASSEGDEELVVDGDEEGEGEQGDGGEGARGDLEVRSEVAVHCQGLEHCEGPLLGQGHEADDAGGPDGDDPDEALHLLNLLHAAEPPWVCDAAVFFDLAIADDRGLIQPTEHKKSEKQDNVREFKFTSINLCKNRNAEHKYAGSLVWIGGANY